MKTRVLAILAISLLTVGCGFTTPSSGERIGTLTSVHQSGILYSTWEGTIVRGGLSGGSGGFATQPYDFTINDPALAVKAQEYMEQQREVRLRFHSRLIYSLASSDSGGHFADSITPNTP